MNAEATPLPYPLPEGWQLTAARPMRVWVAVVWSGIAVVFLAGAAWFLVHGDTGFGLLFTGLFTAAGLGIAVGYERAGGQRAASMMVNAVVLSRAEVRPADSWIHFFRERGPGRWLTGWFAGAGALASAALVWLIVIVAVQGGNALWLLVVLIPLVLFALVVALAGGIAIVLRWRHASFGRRPIGLSLGHHGVIHYYLDGVDVWPWERIAQVHASVSAVDPTTKDFQPSLVIVPEPVAASEGSETSASEASADDARVTAGNTDASDEHVPEEQREYDISTSTSHPYLIYTAVRFWAEHPELRHELSTTFAQRRIEGWRDAMVARRPTGTADATIRI